MDFMDGRDKVWESFLLASSKNKSRYKQEKTTNMTEKNIPFVLVFALKNKKKNKNKNTPPILLKTITL